MQRKPRIELTSHCAFIRTLPCIVTGRSGVDAAHIRYAEINLAKRHCGITERPDDFWVVPLCRDEHDKQHKMNERVYWQKTGIDPLIYALRLYSISGDYEMGCQIVAAARNQIR